MDICRLPKLQTMFRLLGGRPVAPCRVTNTGEEMVEPSMFGDPDYMELDQMQIPHPELGPLERRVEKTYEEALFEGDISPDDAKYWFTEPPGAQAICTACCLQAMDDCVFKKLLWDTGGWNQEKKKLRKATIVPNEYADATNFGEGRVCASSVCSNCMQVALCSP